MVKVSANIADDRKKRRNPMATSALRAEIPDRKGRPEAAVRPPPPAGWAYL
jgi:hypothetical protein